MSDGMVAITGASGYIGKHLLAELVRAGDHRIRVFSKSQHQVLGAAFGSRIEIIEGDMLSPDSLRGFLEPGCTVVNLAYLWKAGVDGNVAATRNLLDACRVANVRRLIHCSTADVVGRAVDNLITENTACQPVTEYSIAKRNVENIILDGSYDSFDIAILRPTAVFGPGGKNLKKLIEDMANGSRLKNYLKSCLFAKRRMNLVNVSNVVAAILFLMHRAENFGGEVFFVSDDDSPFNNFANVERLLMRELDIPNYSIPPLPMPLSLLAFFLGCLGRNNVNPRCDYAPDKLIRLGFKRPVSFEAGLIEYATWYRSFHLKKQGGWLRDAHP